MPTIWKRVPGFDECYKVSSQGEIYSVRRLKPLNGHCSHTGYKHITLSDNNRRRIDTVHRIVAETFIPNPDNKRDVNHKNGNKLDNRVENLEWCTRSENLHHAIEIGLVNSRKRIAQLKDGVVINTFDSAKVAAKVLGLGYSPIYGAASGRYKTAHGYQWKYVA
jgi:hypothetical protein